MKTKSLLFFLCFVILFFTSSFSEFRAQNANKFVVVLDAGHGGHDPGKPTQYGFKEKDVALKIVLKIGEELEKNPSIKVIYTRKTDVFVTLRGRAKIANEADADLFVSIHCNAHNSQAYGTETYVVGVANTQRNFDVAKQENEVILLEDDYEKHYDGFNPNAPESLIGLTLMQEDYIDYSILLAGMIENNFSGKLHRKSRGVKQASLWVMHNTYMPSVLIETGFITNKSEGAYLNSNKGQNEISNAIRDAILEYKKSLDLNVGENLGLTSTIKKEEAQEYNGVEFKVQIAASSKKIEPKSYNFKGLENVSREFLGSLYKYYYGSTSDYNKIKVLHSEAKSKGYASSFIVAFKNGERVQLDDVLKTTSN
ncbi:N-acetylmuramoyl-L-alanine amidase family protein [Formosa sp. S-31]|uniref:N-acetylmuramoyl-L-alanine amidase family protein n=1 Tax=Formosa sp. S-31 TaxID=2790949 RepID=UPI003EB9AF48